MKKIEKDLLGYVITLTVIAVALVLEKLLIFALVPLALYLFPAGMSVRAGRVEFREPVYVGDEVLFTAEFTAYGFGYLRLRCETEETVNVTSGSLASGGFVPGVRRFTISYSGKVRKRGKINFGEISCTSEDVFLLKSREWKLNLDLMTEVRVRVRKVRKVKTRRVKTRESLPDVDISKIGVPGTDFREIRHYRPGDPIKFINWKATARRGEVLVNEFEVEGKRTVWFVVNTSEHEFAEEEYLENALSVTASLCHYFIRRGHKVALTLTGSGRTVYPDVGRRQFFRIVKELTDADFGERSPVDTIMDGKKLMMYHMPFVVYVTSIHDGSRAVIELKKAGMPVKVIVVEGREYSTWLARSMKKLLVREKLRGGAEVVRETIAVRA
ncbi:DUF58 domain-containing protein [Geoglobus sp.]